MESKKLTPTIFSYKRNQLDSVVGKVPMRRLILSFIVIIIVFVALLVTAARLEYQCVIKGELFIESRNGNDYAGRLKIASAANSISTNFQLEVKSTMFHLTTVSTPDLSESGYEYYDVVIRPAQQTADLGLRKQYAIQLSNADCKENFLTKLVDSFR